MLLIILQYTIVTSDKRSKHSEPANVVKKKPKQHLCLQNPLARAVRQAVLNTINTLKTAQGIMKAPNGQRQLTNMSAIMQGSFIDMLKLQINECHVPLRIVYLPVD